MQDVILKTLLRVYMVSRFRNKTNTATMQCILLLKLMGDLRLCVCSELSDVHFYALTLNISYAILREFSLNMARNIPSSLWLASLSDLCTVLSYDASKIKCFHCSSCQ